MARKPALSAETLAGLGAQRLAQIILDEIPGNPGLKKRVTAALAALAGPEAVQKIIDRRLAGLRRGRAVIAWEKERELAADLSATLDSIVKELAPLSAVRAAMTLLDFVETSDGLFVRIDDSGGHIQNVYWVATQALPDLAARLTPREAAALLGRLTLSLSGDDDHGLIARMAAALPPVLPADLLPGWDAALTRLLQGLGEDPRRHGDGLIKIRQAIADARGDLDGYVALDALLPAWQQNPVAVAERLLAAGRLDEALARARRDAKSGRVFPSGAERAEDRFPPAVDIERVTLEARILEARREKPAAQALRWAAFEASFDPGVLRDYIRKLDDFIEHEELARAFRLVAASEAPYRALDFFMEWPRLDLAAALVLDRKAVWDGSHYGFLAPAAAALEPEFPAAATVLYRALLDTILDKAKSAAYGHAADYLVKLGRLAADVPREAGLLAHEEYVETIRTAHGRKAGFWSRVA